MMQKLHKGSLGLAVGLAATAFQAYPQTYDVDTLQYNGDVSTYINIVVLGDGYTSAELGQFATDAENFRSYLFTQTPFKEYRNYFNVFIINVPSPESGIKHPRTASDCPSAASHPVSNPNNHYGTTFDYGGIHRLVVPGSGPAVSVLSNNFPQYDQAFLIANSAQYGGSGGWLATSTINVSAGEIAVHECGHSFAGLADEYWAGAGYASEKPNMTRETDPAIIKWRNWLNVNGVGIFDHTGDPSWKKPRSGQCKMELLNRAFCSVCAEAIAENIHDLAGALTGYLPAAPAVSMTNDTVIFSLSLIEPVANTLGRKWILDGSATAANNVSAFQWSISGSVLAENRDSLVLAGGSLTAGTHTLKAYILDTSALTRSDVHPVAHLDSVIWNIDRTATGITVARNGEAAVRIFPNPISTGPLSVAFTAASPGTVTLQLYDAAGRLVHAKVHDVSAGEQTLQVNMSPMPPGIYHLRLAGEGLRAVHEVVRR